MAPQKPNNGSLQPTHESDEPTYARNETTPERYTVEFITAVDHPDMPPGSNYRPVADYAEIAALNGRPCDSYNDEDWAFRRSDTYPPTWPESNHCSRCRILDHPEGLCQLDYAVLFSWRARRSFMKQCQDGTESRLWESPVQYVQWAKILFPALTWMEAWNFASGVIEAPHGIPGGYAVVPRAPTHNCAHAHHTDPQAVSSGDGGANDDPNGRCACWLQGRDHGIKQGRIETQVETARKAMIVAIKSSNKKKFDLAVKEGRAHIANTTSKMAGMEGKPHLGTDAFYFESEMTLDDLADGMLGAEDFLAE